MAAMEKTRQAGKRMSGSPDERRADA
jgi:hypothetical protein